MTDKEALKRITWPGFGYMVDGVGYDIRNDEDTLPKARLHCHKCVSKEDLLTPAGKVFLRDRNRSKGIICRCHQCGHFAVFPAKLFEKKNGSTPRIHFDFSAEATHRNMMKLKGFDDATIDAECLAMQDEFVKRDRARTIEQKNFEAESRSSYEKAQLEREAKEFKVRLDSGEIKFDTKARAFYEVATGKVVRKL